MISAEVIIKIQFYDLDPMRIVWHGNYPRFLEQARAVLFEKISFGYREMSESGFAWPIVDMRIKYVRPINPSHRSRLPRRWLNTKIDSRPTTSLPMPTLARFSPKRTRFRSRSIARATSYASKLRRLWWRKCGARCESLAHRGDQRSRALHPFASPNSRSVLRSRPVKLCTVASSRRAI